MFRIRGAGFEFAGLIAAALMVVGESAQAKPMVELQPSSDWVLDYAEDSCSLARQFGQGREATVFKLEKFGPSDGALLLLSGHLLDMRSASDVAMSSELRDNTPGHRAHVALQLSNRDGPFNISIMKGRNGNDVPVFASNRSAFALSQIDSVEWLDILEGTMSPLRLHTGSLGDPIRALDTCIDELMTHWGIDVDAHRTIRKWPEPKNDINEWITSADYPRSALIGDFEGSVHFRVIVDKRGKPIECHVQAATQTKAFERAVCKNVMDRAEFNPAIDLLGNPIRSVSFQSVMFYIE